jgi:hypothetical protein
MDPVGPVEGSHRLRERSMIDAKPYRCPQTSARVTVMKAEGQYSGGKWAKTGVTISTRRTARSGHQPRRRVLVRIELMQTAYRP